MRHRDTYTANITTRNIQQRHNETIFTVNSYDELGQFLISLALMEESFKKMDFDALSALKKLVVVNRKLFMEK